MVDSKVKRLMGDKTSRLIDWNSEVLNRMLKLIVARRHELTRTGVELEQPAALERVSGQAIIDEVTEIITLPAFDERTIGRHHNPEIVETDPQVVKQLHDYVTNIAVM
jgi:hypothetical protein